MNKDCELCGGSGRKIIVVNDKWTGKKKTGTVECVCKQSKFISECKDEFPTLTWLGDAYLAPSKIDPTLVFNPYDLAESPNYIFYNPDYYDFCLHMKSVVLRNRFKKDPPLMRCCSSINILQSFYVKQKDGAQRQLSDVNDYDLLIMTLDNKEKNDPLKTVVAQVVYSRLRLRRPTWLYVPSPTLTETNLEYSEELVKYLEEKEVIQNSEGETQGQRDRFLKKKLTPIAGVYIDKKQSQSQQSAAGFGRE